MVSTSFTNRINRQGNKIYHSKSPILWQIITKSRDEMDFFVLFPKKEQFIGILFWMKKMNIIKFATETINNIKPKTLCL